MLPDFGQKCIDLYHVHWKSSLYGVVAIPMYWFLLIWICNPMVYDDAKQDIFTACANGDLQNVTSLVHATVGLDVNRCDVDGKTPLMHAVAHGRVNVVRFLVQEKARIGVRVFEDQGFIQDKLTLCQCTSSSSRPARRRWTALHFAAWKGNPQVLSALLEGIPPQELAVVGASPEPHQPDHRSNEISNGEAWYLDARGDTPMHIAVRFGHPEIVNILVDTVPDWRRVRNEQGLSAWDMSRSAELREILERRPGTGGSQASGVESEMRLAPLLSGEPSGEVRDVETQSTEQWPSKTITFSRTEGRDTRLAAPGLCSFVASSGGGVLGRAFLIDVMKKQDLVAVPENAIVATFDEDKLDGDYAAGTVAPAPKFEDLDPVNKRGEACAWWVNMVEARRAAGNTLTGDMVLQVPHEAELGKGQYGRVWRAKDRRSGTVYAVKNIKAQGSRAATAQNECVAADHMRIKPHPTIVQYFDVHHFADANLYVIVMEFCPGGDLKETIYKKRRTSNTVGRPYEPPPQALHWIGQIFLGLEHLHKQMDTLLRDLKPDNVVLGESGRAQLTDIGFARMGAESDGTWTFGVPPGSPGYVSPEVLRNEKYSSKADLYSFGALIWVLLTGGHPAISEPAPPCSRMRHGTDYRALFEDWQILRDCMTNPTHAGYRGPSLEPDAKDLVLNLTLRKPKKRLDHAGIRNHAFLRPLELPAAGARRDSVEAWLATMPRV